MKANQGIRPGVNDGSISRLEAPVDGMVGQTSNSTPLARLKGMQVAQCENCGLEFRRHYTLLARSAHHYCSKSCFGIATRVRVVVGCSVCGRLIETTPSAAKRPITCSAECFALHRRLRSPNEASGVSSVAVAARSRGANFQEVAELCGLKTRTGGMLILKMADKMSEVLSCVERLRSEAAGKRKVIRRAAE